MNTPGVFLPPFFGGVITNAGSQQNTLAGGQAVADGYIFSTAIAAGTQVNFKLSASVAGLTTSGSGELGLSDGKGKRWGNLQGVTIKITGEVPAATFPLDFSNPDNFMCQSNCNSEIPFWFTGIASVVTQGNHGSSTQSIPILIESAYWDPLGAPIVIASADDGASIFLVLTYTTATINWTGVEVDGVLTGTYGTATVSGAYTTVTNSFENLLAGTEQDSGQISFYGFAVPQLNAKGDLKGSTTFTNAGGVDCSMQDGSTGVPGTCLLTGASSAGTFNMQLSQGGKISGTYGTIWSVPSTFTATTVTATVTQH